jgi:glycosyltransferase involved in cell wall biosynthesis
MQITATDASADVLGLSIATGANTYYRLSVPVATAGGAVTGFYAASEDQIAAAKAVVLSNFSTLPSVPVDAAAQVVRKLQADGCRVLLDYDDEIKDVPAQHRRADRNLPAILRACRQADALVCTNDALAERLRPLNADVRVIPNYVRADWWPTPAPETDGPTLITLTGSASHRSDWAPLAPALRRIRRDYGARVHIRVAGACFDYLRPVVDEHLPWTGDLAAYPAMLAGTHIGLCPLLPTPFNACKSPIKAYEFALSGAAVIGSPTQYGPVLADGRGLICRTEAQWEAAIRAYLDNPNARRLCAAALRSYVASACDARTHAATIAATYLA